MARCSASGMAESDYCADGRGSSVSSDFSRAGPGQADQRGSCCGSDCDRGSPSRSAFSIIHSLRAGHSLDDSVGDDPPDSADQTGAGKLAGCDFCSNGSSCCSGVCPLSKIDEAAGRRLNGSCARHSTQVARFRCGRTSCGGTSRSRRTTEQTA